MVDDVAKLLEEWVGVFWLHGKRKVSSVQKFQPLLKRCIVKIRINLFELPTAELQQIVLMGKRYFLLGWLCFFGCLSTPASDPPDSGGKDVPVSHDETAAMETDRPDGASPDMGLDTALDATPDAEIDSAPDVTLDVPIDRSPDVAPDVPVAPPVDLCAVSPVLDINVMGLNHGRVTTVRLVPTSPGLYPPTSCILTGANTSRRVVARYTSPITATLEFALHSRREPLYLSVRDGCGPAAREMACGGEFGSTAYSNVIFALVRVTAGQTIYVVTTVPDGDISLTITAMVDTIPTGGACTTLGRCAEGSECVNSFCAAPGTRQSRCRNSAMPCDPGLVCAPTLRGMACLPRASVGDPPCTDRCVSLGDTGQPCRNTAPRCNTGLTCRTDGFVETCVTSFPPGALCSTDPAERACDPHSLCVDVGGTMRCVADGQEGGWCNGASRCAEGLVCDFPAERCYRPEGVGARCTPGVTSTCGRGTGCVAGICTRLGREGTACVANFYGFPPYVQCDPDLACTFYGPGDSRCTTPIPLLGECAASSSCGSDRSCLSPRIGERGRCVAPGMRDMPCRNSFPVCDSGLLCTQTNRCVEPQPEAGACDVTLQDCATGLGCVGGVCVREGANRGFCRFATPACDDPRATCVSHETAPACWVVATNPPCSIATGLPCVSTTEYCAPVSGSAVDGVCRRRSILGEACDATGVSGAPCFYPGWCDGTGHCLALRPAGASCADAPFTCDSGLSCSSFSQCAPDGAHHAPCRAAEPQCDVGLACRGTARGLCVEVHPAGASCLDSNECAVNTHCSFGVCRPDGGPLRPCRTTGSPCDFGLRCDSGTCRDTRALGSLCTTAGQCPSSMDCSPGPSGSTCQPSAYTVETLRDVVVDDPCNLPVIRLSTPMAIRLFGNVIPVVATTSGSIRLDMRDVTISVRPRPGVDELLHVVGCARIVGTAPFRRLLVGGRLSSRSTALTGETNVVTIFSETTGVIEMQYISLLDPRLLEFDVAEHGTPRLSITSSAGFQETLGPFIAFTQGTAVRFTPR
jgi:hypothetical protein